MQPLSKSIGRDAPLHDQSSIPVPEVFESKWSAWDDAIAQLDGQDAVFVHRAEERGSLSPEGVRTS